MAEPTTEQPITFAELGLRRAAQRARHAGLEEPTPIQAAAIPVLLEGHDMLGQAATGTGKTAAFALPILQRLPADGRGREPMALISGANP